MRQLANTLGTWGRVLFAAVIGAVIIAVCEYRAFNPPNLDLQGKLDIELNPWASASGAAAPGIVGAIIFYFILIWRSKALNSNDSSRGYSISQPFGGNKNFARGLFRIWIVLSGLWIVAAAGLSIAGIVPVQYPGYKSPVPWVRAGGCDFQNLSDADCAALMRVLWDKYQKRDPDAAADGNPFDAMIAAAALPALPPPPFEVLSVYDQVLRFSALLVLPPIGLFILGLLGIWSARGFESQT